MNQEFYATNRAAFASAMEPGDVAVFFSGRAKHNTADEYYPFFAHRNFICLTGITQADGVLLLKKGDSGCENLSAATPRTIEEIEDDMGNSGVSKVSGR